MRFTHIARILVVFGLLVQALSSCVPANKLIYLQKGDELKKRNKFPKDSVIRTHQLNVQEYRIQPLDLISVTFETIGNEDKNFDFLSKLSPQSGNSGSTATASAYGVLVNKDGDVEYAVLGKIKVAGLTIFEAQDSIRAMASKFISNVVVRVRLLNFRFTILGEVNGESTVTSPNTRLTISEAIGLSGGMGELADRRNVKVIRQNKDKTEIYYIDLLDEQLLESKYYFVQQNDVIIVPPLRQRTFRRYFVGNLGIITATISFVTLIYAIAR